MWGEIPHYTILLTIKNEIKMKIKSYNNSFILSPIEVKQLFNINTNKFVVIEKESKDFTIETAENCNGSAADWIDEEVDGRKLRKVKREIIRQFGDIVLDEYKTTERIYETLSKKFINTSEISDIMKNALSNEMNVVFYGKGGFGKSEMMGELFGCPELQDRVFVKSLSEATTEEDLFGGINIKKMTDTGVLEYNCENSFANKEIVILEELFDAPARVLAALKDTLTSKEIRNGNQRFPIKTKIIIGLTNKTMDELIEDDSIEALMQRFAISYKMEYNIDAINTAALVINRYKDISENKLAAIVATIGELPNLTPRKILETAKYIRNLNVRKNKVYSEKITNHNITPVIDFLKNTRDVALEKTLMRKIVDAKLEIKDGRLCDYDELINLQANLQILKNVYIGDTTLAVKQNLGKEIDEMFTLITSKVA